VYTVLIFRPDSGMAFILVEPTPFLQRPSGTRETPPDAIVAVGEAGMGDGVVQGGAEVLRSLLTTPAPPCKGSWHRAEPPCLSWLEQAGSLLMGIMRSFISILRNEEQQRGNRYQTDTSAHSPAIGSATSMQKDQQGMRRLHPPYSASLLKPKL